MPELARRTTIARHRAEMRDLLGAARRVAPGRRGEPIYRVWTLPDLLAHVAAWDRWLLGAVDELLSGRRPRFGRTSVFNKHAVDASRAQTYAGIVRSVRGTHKTLMARLARLSDEDWSRKSRHRYHWGDKSPITIASLFAYRYQGRTHYGGHADEIEAWLER